MSRLMWKTFSKIRGFNAVKKHYKYGFQDPKYKYYALYSWGCPFIITGTTVLMQYLPDEYISNGLTKPRIGKNNCFIDNKGTDLPQLWYFHMFNAPILVRTTILTRWGSVDGHICSDDFRGFFCFIVGFGRPP